MMDSADPVEGWSVKDWVNKAPIAKKDVYGSLFFHIQDVLLRFCRRIEKLEVRFQIFQIDALELPTVIEGCGIGKHSFDRIEVYVCQPRTIIVTEGSPGFKYCGLRLSGPQQNPHDVWSPAQTKDAESSCHAPDTLPQRNPRDPRQADGSRTTVLDER